MLGARHGRSKNLLDETDGVGDRVEFCDVASRASSSFTVGRFGKDSMGTLHEREVYVVRRETGKE
jgi:hypothetical protein